MDDESSFLSAAYADPVWIDKGVAAGLTAEHFQDFSRRTQWQILLELRTAGNPVGPAEVYAAGTSSGRLDKCGGLAGITDCSTSDGMQAFSGEAYLQVLLTGRAKREAYRLATRAKEMLEAPSVDLDEVRTVMETAAGACSGRVKRSRSIDDASSDLDRQLAEAKSGKVDEKGLVRWGIPKADRYMQPMKMQELVYIGARPSVGKSSLGAHLANVNLFRGLITAIFTLETTDTAVLGQMAAQRAGVSLSDMREWLPEHHARFDTAKREIVATKRLHIFDDIMTIDGIAAKCRMLAASIKPHLVIVDHMSLIQAPGKGQYERATVASNRCVEIKKTLGCTMIVLNQLNRSTASDNAEPTAAALRETGHAEQDASRIVLVHWIDNHLLDTPTRNMKFLQVKNRIGPTTSVTGITFHAPTTRFYETANN